jgi:hypothetical protein
VLRLEDCVLDKESSSEFDAVIDLREESVLVPCDNVFERVKVHEFVFEKLSVYDRRPAVAVSVADSACDAVLDCVRLTVWEPIVGEPVAVTALVSDGDAVRPALSVRMDKVTDSVAVTPADRLASVRVSVADAVTENDIVPLVVFDGKSADIENDSVELKVLVLVGEAVLLRTDVSESVLVLDLRFVSEADGVA